jgi:hypothetical protein
MSFISQFDDARFHNRDAVCLSISSPLNLNAFFDSPHHRCGGPPVGLRGRVTKLHGFVTERRSASKKRCVIGLVGNRSSDCNVRHLASRPFGLALVHRLP